MASTPRNNLDASVLSAPALFFYQTFLTLTFLIQLLTTIPSGDDAGDVFGSQVRTLKMHLTLKNQDDSVRCSASKLIYANMQNLSVVALEASNLFGPSPSEFATVLFAI
ncbi:hypothetical protein RUM44_013487 [Polyplax serrata]|uniref:Uncharacterized protein n=1 Tax=Polyplax serrata TaxID=468196 RepID=A0ABR1BIG2_POLSC